MKVLIWFILVYVVLGLQSGLSPYIAINGASPNLVLPVIIFIALYAPRDAALLSTYIVGLMQDVISQEPLGVHALVYAAVTAVVRLTQPVLHREHWLTHVVLAISASAVHAAMLELVGLRLPPRPPWDLLLSAGIYTAVVTPILLKLLHKMRWAFAFMPERKLPGRI